MACNALASCSSLESKIRPVPMELQDTRVEIFADDLLKRLQVMIILSMFLYDSVRPAMPRCIGAVL